MTSDSSCNHWTQPIPPTSRFLPFLGLVRQTYIHHSAFISSTLTDPSYERERFDYSYHSAYYLILKRPLPPPSRSSFPTEKRFIDCPTPAHSTLSVSPRATILFAGTRPSAFHGFLSEDVSLLEFRPRFFRQSGTEIASPVSSYRLAKVPGSKVETVERKKMVGTLQTWTETFPLSPFAFFHPVIYNPSLKVSLSPPSLL